jgi:hypothetical protein
MDMLKDVRHKESDPCPRYSHRINSTVRTSLFAYVSANIASELDNTLSRRGAATTLLIPLQHFWLGTSSAARGVLD